MKLRPWLVAAAMSVSSLALAQGVTESTDPAKIAAIEQHAQQLTSGTQSTAMMGDHDTMRKHGMHHKRGMHKHGMRHHKGMHAKPPEDKPMANESKG